MTRANCTVKAFASVTEITYTLAEGIAGEAGRIGGRKFKSSLLIEEAKKQGFTFKKLRFAGKTINKFVAQYPDGRFYARKKGHAFSVVDGVVNDKTAMGSIVLDVWQFLPTVK